MKPFDWRNFKDGDLLPEGMGGVNGQFSSGAVSGINSGARECIEPTCGVREKINPDGSCSKCDEFTVVSSDGRQCVMPDCAFNEKVEMDGTCTICEPYTRVTSDRLFCEIPDCKEREIITIQGSCEICSPFEFPDDL